MIELKDIKIDCYACNFMEDFSIKDRLISIEDLIRITEELYYQLKEKENE